MARKKKPPKTCSVSSGTVAFSQLSDSDKPTLRRGSLGAPTFGPTVSLMAFKVRSAGRSDRPLTPPD